MACDKCDGIFDGICPQCKRLMTVLFTNMVNTDKMPDIAICDCGYSLQLTVVKMKDMSGKKYLNHYLPRGRNDPNLPPVQDYCGLYYRKDCLCCKSYTQNRLQSPKELGICSVLGVVSEWGICDQWELQTDGRFGGNS